MTAGKDAVALTETERLMIRNRLLSGEAAEYVDAALATMLSHHLAPTVAALLAAHVEAVRVSERVAGEVEALMLSKAASAALRLAADNMPISRPGQGYEHAAGWLRRRADALDAALVPVPGVRLTEEA